MRQRRWSSSPGVRSWLVQRSRSREGKRQSGATAAIDLSRDPGGVYEGRCARPWPQLRRRPLATLWDLRESARRPRLRRYDERPVRQPGSAQITQSVPLPRAQVSDIRAGRAHAKREWLPPLLEARVLDLHG